MRLDICNKAFLLVIDDQIECHIWLQDALHIERALSTLLARLASGGFITTSIELLNMLSVAVSGVSSLDLL